jgi:protein TonB
VPITYALRPEGPDALSIKSGGYDTPPSYPGGEAALHSFIASNVVYPESARQNRISGRVLVNYCITPEGRISCVSVYKGVDPVLDAEAARVVSKLSGWQPARLKGTPVTIYYQLAVNFSLQ